MTLTHLTLRISIILALLGLVLGIIGTGLVGASIYFNLNGSRPAEALAEEADCQQEEACTTQYTLQPAGENSASPALTGTPTLILPNPGVGQDETLTADAAAQRFKPIEDAPPVATQARQNPTPTRTKIPTPTEEVKGQALEELLKLPTSTPDPLEVKSRPGARLEVAKPDPSTIEVESPPPAENPVVAEPTADPLCPASPSAAFELIPIEGHALRDHPAEVHGDLNLALRGYVPSGEALLIISY
jgi:hypothetical protein